MGLFKRKNAGLLLTSYKKYEKDDSVLGGIRVVTCVPSYGSAIPVVEKHIRAAIMHSANKGARWVGDISPDRESHSGARNIAATKLTTHPMLKNVDGIVWIDNDMFLQPNDITNLLLEVNKRDLDFVTSIYYQRRPPYNPLTGIWNEDKTKIKMMDDFPANTLVPIDGTGFGLVYTSRPMFDAISALPDFNMHGGWFPDNRSSEVGMGEDYSFCKYAQEAGYQLWVHTGVQPKHVGEYEFIGKKQFDAYREANTVEGEKVVRAI